MAARAGAPQPQPPVSRTRRGALVKRAVALAVTGISLYLVAPSLVEVFASWPDIAKLDSGWLVVMAALEASSLALASHQELSALEQHHSGIGVVDHGARMECNQAKRAPSPQLLSAVGSTRPRFPCVERRSGAAQRRAHGLEPGVWTVDTWPWRRPRASSRQRGETGWSSRRPDMRRTAT